MEALRDCLGLFPFCANGLFFLILSFTASYVFLNKLIIVWSALKFLLSDFWNFVFKSVWFQHVKSTRN